MHDYTITWFEFKPTKDGKPKAEVTITDTQGQPQTVTMWGDFPNFEHLKVGDKIVGYIAPSKDPKYKASIKPKAGAGTLNSAPTRSFTQKPSGAVEAAKLVGKNVERAQDNKDESIKISSTMRDAVQCALACYENDTNTTLDMQIEHWRKWLWQHWDDPLDYPPFN